MRLTWLVLGVVAAAGAVAFINTDEEPVELPEAATEGSGGAVALQRGSGAQGAGAAPPLSQAEGKQEKHAKTLLEGMARALAAGNTAQERALAKRLQREAWDAPSSRRWAYARGRRLLEQAGGRQGKKAIGQKDQARRLLSRAVYLPEMFRANGASTDERTQLIQMIQKVNRQVMRYRSGIEGVTRPYEVPTGITPVQIISRERLSMGSNGLLFWNQGGNLDPKRLRALIELAEGAIESPVAQA